MYNMKVNTLYSRSSYALKAQLCLSTFHGRFKLNKLALVFGKLGGSPSQRQCQALQPGDNSYSIPFLDNATPCDEGDNKYYYQDNFVWEQAILTLRELKLAVKEESFQVAARLRDALEPLRARMLNASLFQFINVETLMKDNSTKPDLLNALSNLESSGDLRSLPYVVAVCFGSGSSCERLRRAAVQTVRAIRARAYAPRAVHLCSKGDALLVQLQSYEASMDLVRDLGQRATELYSAALSEDARCAMAYAGRGGVSYCFGRYEAAVMDFEQALEIDPTHIPTLHLLVLARGQLKQFDAARRSLYMAPMMDGEDVELHKVLDRWERESAEWVGRYRRARGDPEFL